MRDQPRTNQTPPSRLHDDVLSTLNVEAPPRTMDLESLSPPTPLFGERRSSPVDSAKPRLPLSSSVLQELSAVTVAH
jgi:hypothetical protein